MEKWKLLFSSARRHALAPQLLREVCGFLEQRLQLLATPEQTSFGNFPRIRGTFLRVLIIRTGIFLGLYWGSPILGNYQILLASCKLKDIHCYHYHYPYCCYCHYCCYHYCCCYHYYGCYYLYLVITIIIIIVIINIIVASIVVEHGLQEGNLQGASTICWHSINSGSKNSSSCCSNTNK